MITQHVNELLAIDEQLERVANELRRDLARKAVRAGVEPVKRDAKELAPRSKDSNTRDKWSAKTAEEREGVKELAETIGIVVREYDGIFLAIVGPQYPAGALGHLVEQEHKLVAWGVTTGTFVDGNPFMEPAADRTKDEQQRAVINTITVGVQQILATG